MRVVWFFLIILVSQLFVVFCFIVFFFCLFEAIGCETRSDRFHDLDVSVL